MKKITVAVYILFLSLSCFAAEEPPTAEVMELSGGVSFAGKPLHKGQIISGKGELLSGRRSSAKIFIKKWHSDIQLGADTSMRLDLTAETKYTLTGGICRWISRAVVGEKMKKGMQIQGRSASIGVRGTDFTLKQDETSAATEIVVADGEVIFRSRIDTGSEARVKKGQWGGVGGKFGAAVQGPKDISEEQLKDFMSAVLK